MANNLQYNTVIAATTNSFTLKIRWKLESINFPLITAKAAVVSYLRGTPLILYINVLGSTVIPTLQEVKKCHYQSI